ncbi:MAG: hypothetical protein ACEQSR_01285 [Candidatus Methylacidiphilales bacterium]
MFEFLSNKNKPGGYAGLDRFKKIAISMLPQVVIDLINNPPSGGVPSVINEGNTFTINSNQELIAINVTNNGIVNVDGYLLVANNLINNGFCQINGTLLVGNAILGSGSITGTGNLI